MTDILPGFGHFLGRSTPFSMPHGGGAHDWRGPPQSAYNQLPMLTNGWSDDPHGSQVVAGGMQDVDLAMFQHPTPRYHDSLSAAAGGAAPGASSTSYAFPSDPNHHTTFHPADVDMRTPSSTGYPTDVGTAEYPVSLPSTTSNGYLRAPMGSHSHAHASIPAASPRVKGGEIAPRLTAAASDPTGTAKPPRPSLPRAATAPETSEPNAPGKRATGSDGEDEDYNPQEDVKNRGRKRQRIPHTAVERRYRENLNAHLDRLRQQVPALSGRSGNELGGHEGVKPSKCEILNGAIEHISALDRENQALKNEVKLLKARYDEMDRFYRGNPPGGPYGA